MGKKECLGCGKELASGRFDVGNVYLKPNYPGGYNEGFSEATVQEWEEYKLFDIVHPSAFFCEICGLTTYPRYDKSLPKHPGFRLGKVERKTISMLVKGEERVEVAIACPVCDGEKFMDARHITAGRLEPVRCMNSDKGRQLFANNCLTNPEFFRDNLLPLDYYMTFEKARVCANPECGAIEALPNDEGMKFDIKTNFKCLPCSLLSKQGALPGSPPKMYHETNVAVGEIFSRSEGRSYYRYTYDAALYCRACGYLVITARNKDTREYVCDYMGTDAAPEHDCEFCRLNGLSNKLYDIRCVDYADLVPIPEAEHLLKMARLKLPTFDVTMDCARVCASLRPDSKTPLADACWTLNSMAKMDDSKEE